MAVEQVPEARYSDFFAAVEVATARWSMKESVTNFEESRTSG